jgi:hypothetical protein
MKKKVKKELEINLDTISDKILKEIGNCQPNKLGKLKGDASEFLVKFSFKLAEEELGITATYKGLSEKQLKPYFEKTMIMVACEIFVRKGFLRKTGPWFNPSYIETELGKLIRKEKK